MGFPRLPELGEEIVCSVCSQQFKVHGDTKYIINGGYTCSWKCFLDCHREKEKQRKEKKK
jgi:hypothetical protein